MGTKLRHILGTNLKELESQLESLPEKVEIKAINTRGDKWFIHFCILDMSYMDPLISEKNKSNKTVKKVKKVKVKPKTNSK